MKPLSDAALAKKIVNPLMEMGGGHLYDYNRQDAEEFVLKVLKRYRK